ncbi:hypothetical protein AVEN_230949-1 [Araneus ventricosus]|uniref:Uncharacterized protein n=1 Tax=Araneus ventricosus TaxID=182803 RepID=A0A4Y2A2M7_ARAVE|nr:hypothetical protein AVEN_230949-1 [Araneus ventricosus]
MLAHRYSVWCLNPADIMKRKPSFIRVHSYRVHSYSIYWEHIATPQWQPILGIPYIHMQLQFEARSTSIYRLRIPFPSNITDIQLQDLEIQATGWSLHTSKHIQPNHISLEDEETNVVRNDMK